jgi:hypothetical protein
MNNDNNGCCKDISVPSLQDKKCFLSGATDSRWFHGFELYQNVYLNIGGTFNTCPSNPKEDELVEYLNEYGNRRRKLRRVECTSL